MTFIVDRNINYTNICVNKCKFCAFYREAESPDAYILSKDEIFKKIEETIAQGGTQILMQGGVHPDLGIDYFEELFQSIKMRYQIHIHSLSPSEISFVAKKADLSIKNAITRLKAAGLDSIPGGGAEILVDRVRKKVSPNKIRWRQWADVMKEAQKLGMPTTATMMFGSLETDKEIIEHLVTTQGYSGRDQRVYGVHPLDLSTGEYGTRWAIRHCRRVSEGSRPFTHHAR